jgi:hypothetical protein
VSYLYIEANFVIVLILLGKDSLGIMRHKSKCLAQA